MNNVDNIKTLLISIGFKFSVLFDDAENYSLIDFGVYEINFYSDYIKIYKSIDDEIIREYNYHDIQEFEIFIKEEFKYILRKNKIDKLKEWIKVE